jgi:branched-chain amino acid transport system ATP-binding protein
MTTPVLEARGLAKTFGGVAAVAGVDLTVQAGRILALIGPNGAGKSTCFNLLNGQIRPDRGRVLLDGRDATGLSPRAIWRRGVGRTFQITATFASMTVRENVQIALLSVRGAVWNPFGRAVRRHAEEADALLALVGMGRQADQACGVLSYGDLKRVELAVALANTPRLLLMDEPTAGMAPAERIALMGLAARLARDRGIAVLFTEHDMDVVFAHADRVMVLDRGRVIAEGSPSAVRADPAVRRVYLGGDGSPAPC